MWVLTNPCWLWGKLFLHCLSNVRAGRKCSFPTASLSLHGRCISFVPEGISNWILYQFFSAGCTELFPRHPGNITCDHSNSNFGGLIQLWLIIVKLDFPVPFPCLSWLVLANGIEHTKSRVLTHLQCDSRLQLLAPWYHEPPRACVLPVLGRWWKGQWLAQKCCCWVFCFQLGLFDFPGKSMGSGTSWTEWIVPKNPISLLSPAGPHPSQWGKQRTCIGPSAWIQMLLGISDSQPVLEWFRRVAWIY